MHRCTRIHQGAAELNRELAGEDSPLSPSEIGMHTGEAIVGNMGVSRFSITPPSAIPSTSLQRLEGANKYFGHDHHGK
jgi:class 3 adenylate cyclase